MPALHPRLAARAGDTDSNPLISIATDSSSRVRSGHTYAAVREAARPRRSNARRRHRGDAHRAGIHPRAHEREDFRKVTERYRDSNMETVVLNGLYFPFVDLLFVHRARGRPRLRRPSLLPGRHHARDALRLPPLRPELLRPGPAAFTAVQHVPVGDGGPGQDRGRAGGTGGSRRARREAVSRGSRGTFASKASGSATATGRRSFTASTSTSRPEPRSPSSVARRAGKSTIAKLLARFYDPREGRESRSTGTTSCVR